MNISMNYRAAPSKPGTAGARYWESAMGSCSALRTAISSFLPLRGENLL